MNPQNENITNVTKVTERVQSLLLPNMDIKQKIADACGVNYFTVHRWVKKRSPRLTQVDSLRVIRECTGLTDEQILTTEKPS